MPDAHDWFERMRASFQPSPFAKRALPASSNCSRALRPKPRHASHTKQRGIYPAPAGLASAVVWMPASDDRSLFEIAMHALSRVARFILDRMERDRRYEALDLRAFVPNASA
jgi:hypothetical protein